VPDLDALRDDVAAFAAVVGHPLSGPQARALGLEARTTVILAPRQTGKSRSLGVCALWWAFRRARQTVLVVSAGEDAARRLLALVRTVAAHPLLAGSVVDESGSRVTLSNGSAIVAVPASERAIRGTSADLLLVDEAALVSDDVLLSAALPTTAARPDARIVLASTPWAEGGAFHRHVMAGDSAHQRVFRWSLGDAPWITRGVIEAARLSMSPARFAAEFEADWSDLGGALFSRRLLESCAAEVVLPEWGPAAPCRAIAGVDYGTGGRSDLSVLGMFARLPVAELNPGWEPGLPVYAGWTRAWVDETPLWRVAADVAAARSPWSLVTSEENGLGRGPTEELARLFGRRPVELGGGRAAPRVVVIEEGEVPPGSPFALGGRLAPVPRDPRAIVPTRLHRLATTADTKALGYERIRWLAERGQLTLPRDGDLLRELAGLRVSLTAGGGERIEGPPGGHDDRPDALYIAAGVFRDRRTRRLRCVLAEHAERRTREADVPALDEPVVERGDGLRVYRRPPLQSVAGPGLAVPVGVRERREPEDPRWAGVRERVAAVWADRIDNDNNEHEVIA
jgi:hypothetical protein